MKTCIRIGSRESRLAVVQAEIVRQLIRRSRPDIRVEIITMKTTGDRLLGQSLDKIGGKGLFVKELDRALMNGEIDLAVHSLKDMPMETAPELPILAYTKRADPRDVLIYQPGQTQLPAGALIGTSSRRRTVQLQRMYPDCSFRGIRGNVQTRLKKLTEEDYDATILAAAGLQRLGMGHISGRLFEVHELLPAAGQGILAVQGRKGELYPWMTGINVWESETAALAEREFVAALDGGCSSATAAYARINDHSLVLTGLYHHEAAGSYHIETMSGDANNARRLGERLAAAMKKKFS